MRMIRKANPKTIPLVANQENHPRHILRPWQLPKKFQCEKERLLFDIHAQAAYDAQSNLPKARDHDR